MARLTLTDFDEWLDGAVQTDVEDVYALHEAVDGETEFAQYKAERAPNGQLLVSYGDDSPWLRLSTEEAKQGFLRRLGGRSNANWIHSISHQSIYRSWSACWKQ